MTGRTLSHFEILDTLGRGGMGVVYRAVDRRLDRQVALKLLPPDLTADPERRERLAQEARAASALNHPNIVTIYEIDRAPSDDGPVHFIAMEYVDGEPLVSQRPLLELFGTPPEDKRLAILEGGHVPVDTHGLVREILDWLDRYLGPVTPPAAGEGAVASGRGATK